MNRTILFLLVIFTCISEIKSQEKQELGERIIKQVHGRLDMAKVQVDNLVSTYEGSNDYENWYLRAYVYTQLAKSEVYKNIVSNPEREAIYSVKKSKELDKKRVLEPERINVLFDLGAIFYNKGINYYNKAVMQYDHNLISNYNEALINFEYFLEVIEILGDDKSVIQSLFDYNMVQMEKVYLFSGFCAYKLKNYEKAEYYYKKLISFNTPINEARRKDYYLAYIYYADLLLEKKDTSKAIRVIERGLEVFPDSSDVLASLIDIYSKTKRYSDLQDVLEKILRYNTKPNAKILLLLAQTYNKLSRDFKKKGYINTSYEFKIKAIETYEQIINSSTKDKNIIFKAYYNLGVIHYNEGVEKYKNYQLDEKKEYEFLFRKAVLYLEKAYELEPKNKSVADMLIKSYAILNETEKAKKIEKNLY